jgi:CHASE3 domain sensor protein
MLLSGKIRLTFVQKLIVSFTLIGVFLITAVVYAIIGLNTMHRMVDDIARNDLTAATVTITLRDNMLALQRAAGRFHILKQPEFREIYRRQTETFRLTLAKLQQQSGGADIGPLTKAFDSYSTLVERMFNGDVLSDVVLKRAAEKVEQAIEVVRS